MRDHCTWYAVAPTTGFQATSGVEYTVGRERALARSRPFGVRPETYGVPPEVIAGRAAFPKLATRPVIVSHTGIAGAYPLWRNVDDDQLRAIAATDGVVGVIFAWRYLGRRRGGVAGG